jgi:type IV pilus assembly protein PilB
VNRFEWVPPVDPSAQHIPAHVVDMVPAALARENDVMPVALAGGVLTVAVARPADLELLEKLRFVLGVCDGQIEFVGARADAIRAAVARYYGGAGPT